MSDEIYMRRALELAERGRGLVSPGALVGAVIVRERKIVGEGFYTWDGLYHAEVQALGAAGESARGATLYVTMEPCAHFGRTPPCADAVAAAGIARVVAATGDPNPRVAGQGFTRLREAGIRVERGLLEAEARKRNEAYLHAAANRRPFGILKLAMTLDGKIATAAGESQWITSAAARARAQQLRHAADALLTGSGTVLADDPLLTDRSGAARRRPLLRAVIDRRGRLTARRRIFSAPDVVVYTAAPHLELPPGVEVVAGVTALEAVIADLARRQVQSVLLECGPDLAFDALRQGVIDKIAAFVAPKLIGGREVPALGGAGVARLQDALTLTSWSVETVGPDLLIEGYVHRNH